MPAADSPPRAPLHRVYDGVLYSDSTDRPDATTEVGGFWHQPNLPLSYLLGARRLIDDAQHSPDGRLDAVAFPIAYLQRHALELALKQLIDGARTLRHSEKWLSLLERDKRDAHYPERPKRHKGHVFSEILGTLKTELAALEWTRQMQIPPTIHAIAEKLTAIEQSDFTLLRYGKFEKPVVLKLGTVQCDLEALFEQEFWVENLEQASRSDSIYASLVIANEAIDQHIYPLEERYGFMIPAASSDGEDEFIVIPGMRKRDSADHE